MKANYKCELYEIRVCSLQHRLLERLTLCNIDSIKVRTIFRTSYYVAICNIWIE